MATSTTLSAAGPRTVVTEDEARQTLIFWTDTLAANAAASPPVAVTTLNISCRAWPLSTLEILEPALTQIAATVTTLQTDDIIASLPTDDGFATLAFFNRIFHPDNSPNITTIDLSDNALGTRSLNHIGDLLERSPRLAHLSLHNCGMSKEVALQLSDRLGGIAPQLKSLALGRNQMGPEGAKHFGGLLAQCTALERFSYAGSRPLAEGTLSLMGGLVSMAENCSGGKTALAELDLDDMIFGTGAEHDEDALLPLCKVIRASPNLRKLVVKDGGLEQDGFDTLVNALVEGGSTSIEYLDVGCLDLEVDGATALATYIGDNCKDTLVELHCETNTIEDDGLAALLPVLEECSKLKVLNIAENGLEEDGFRALAETKIPTLDKLYMKDNMEEDIDDDVKDSIRKLYRVVLMADDDEETEEAASEEATAEDTAAAEEAATAVDDLADAIGSIQV